MFSQRGLEGRASTAPVPAAPGTSICAASSCICRSHYSPTLLSSDITIQTIQPCFPPVARGGGIHVQAWCQRILLKNPLRVIDAASLIFQDYIFSFGYWRRRLRGPDGRQDRSWTCHIVHIRVSHSVLLLYIHLARTLFLPLRSYTYSR
jgi:hypothetical protein